MKRDWSKLILMSLILAFPVALVHAVSYSAHPSIATEIRAAYAQQDKAASNKDLVAFMATMTPDFVGMTQSGNTLTRQKVKQSMAALFQSASHISGATTIQTIEVKSGKACVTASAHDIIVIKNAATQELSTVTSDEVDYDVWRKVGGVWKEESSKTLSQSDSTQPGTPLDSTPSQTT